MPTAEIAQHLFSPAFIQHLCDARVTTPNRRADCPKKTNYQGETDFTMQEKQRDSCVMLIMELNI